MATVTTDERERRRQRIYETICDVPKGAVASYGQIAELAGIPRGARQVGRALRELPKGSAVPWYRILTASGKLAFDVDSAALMSCSGSLLQPGIEPARQRFGEIGRRTGAWRLE